MEPLARHLNDEHMRLYEWSGAGTGMAHAIPARSKRSHPWHASYAVLAVLTSLLVLNGCAEEGPTRTANERTDRESREQQEGTTRDDAVEKSNPAQDTAAVSLARGKPRHRVG